MWFTSGFSIVGLVVIFQNVNCQTPSLAKTVAKDLAIEYAVQTNFAAVGNAPHSAARLSITHTGNNEFPESGYSIFFCHDNFLFPLTYQQDRNQYVTAPYGNDFVIEGYLLKFHKGCMYELKEVYDRLKPGETKNLTMYFEPFTVSKYDAFPNWYVVDSGNKTAVIDNTRDLSFVEEFKTPLNQLRRTDDLDSVPLEPQDRYAEDQFVSGIHNETIPTPRKQTFRNGRVNVKKGTWRIEATGLGNSDLKRLKQYLQAETSMKIADSGKNVISLELRNRNTFPTESFGPHTEEAYELRIRDNRIRIIGADIPGLINGIHTFLSQEAWGKIPIQTIQDGPRFKERALLLDIASNFYGLKGIMQIVNVMAYYKLNKLYLRLYNNEGLRLDLGLGAVQMASRRCHDISETDCLLTQLGSRPDGSGSGNGYLTIQDFQYLLNYTKDRNIDIIPVLNMGNARAIVVGTKSSLDATKSLYDESEKDTLQIPGRYPDKDTSLNPCRKETVTFIKHVLQHLKAVYSAIGLKLNRIHFGDDFNVDQMMTSKHCFPVRPRNVTELAAARSKLTMIKGDFLTDIGKLFETENVNLGGSMNFFTGFPDNQGFTRMTIMDKSKRYKTIDAYVVNDDFITLLAPPAPNQPMEFLFQRGVTCANNGYKVIQAPPHFTKFDTAYEPDPHSPGDYSVSTRNVSLRQAFSWAPNSRCCNSKLSPEQTANVIQMHGCIISELCQNFSSNVNPGFEGVMATLETRKLRDIQEALKLLIPRGMAFAERAWHEAPWESTFTAATSYKPSPNEILPPVDPRPTLSPNFDDQDKDFKRFLSIIGYKDILRLATKNIPVFCAAPGARLETNTNGVEELVRSCMYPNMEVYGKNKRGKWVNATRIRLDTFDIQCKHKLQSFRNIFNCKEAEFNSTLIRTPYRVVLEHTRNVTETLKRQAEEARQMQINQIIQQRRAFQQQQLINEQIRQRQLAAQRAGLGPGQQAGTGQGQTGLGQGQQAGGQQAGRIRGRDGRPLGQQRGLAGQEQRGRGAPRNQQFLLGRSPQG